MRRNGIQTRWIVGLTLFSHLLLFPCLSYVQTQIDYTLEPTGSIPVSQFREFSGIVSTNVENHYWGIGDSGSTNAMFLFDSNGTVLQRIDLMEAENVDWEAMARKDDDEFVIVDAGDNRLNRKEYTLYTIKEPIGNDVAFMDAERISFRYGDGASHNCEAAFFRNGALYLLTKNISGNSKVFALELSQQDLILTARYVGSLNFGDIRFPLSKVVTDANYSAQDQLLAVMTYYGVVFYRVEHEADLMNAPVGYFPGSFGLCEAICFDGDALTIGNEDGALWTYGLDVFLPNAGVLDWTEH